jgi:hypothetical protein
MFKAFMAWRKVLKKLRTGEVLSVGMDEINLGDGIKVRVKIEDMAFGRNRTLCRLYIKGLQIPLGPWRRFRLRNHVVRFGLTKIGQAI